MRAERPIAAVSWSGGKDSCLALLTARETVDVRFGLTMMDEASFRGRSHGLRSDLIDAQMRALGLSWLPRPCSWDSYERAFLAGLRDLSSAGVTHLVCGDILYPQHKAWVEDICAAAGLTAVEPLWGRRTIDLCHEFIGGGGVARIVVVNASALGPEWLFRELDAVALAELEAIGIDPGGENGEYHTVVTDCSAFAAPLTLEPGDRVLRDGCWAVDLRLARPP